MSTQPSKHWRLGPWSACVVCGAHTRAQRTDTGEMSCMVHGPWHRQFTPFEAAEIEAFRAMIDANTDRLKATLSLTPLPYVTTTKPSDGDTVWTPRPYIARE